MAEVLEKGSALGVDIRQGSIFYDSVAGVCQKIASFYADLATAFDLVILPTAVGEYLDQKGYEYGITRNVATSARYEFRYEGTKPTAGGRFFADSLYFVLVDIGGVLFLDAEKTGTGGNYIASGTAAVPVNTINGLTASSFGELIDPGINTEDDESYRSRIQEKLGGSAENGNQQHYKTWCEEVSGVGRARIIPLFAGENTVMGVIIGSNGEPAVEAVVERVQEYIDPATKGLTVEYKGNTVTIGDGLGNGAANIGAHFAAVAAENYLISVSFSAVLVSGASQQDLAEEASEAIQDYFKELALDASEGENVVVRISTVGSLLYALPSIVDYSSLLFNGLPVNIELESTQVAVLEGVEVI